MTGLRLRNLIDGSTSEVDADALFIAIGHTPNTAIFAGQLDLDERATSFRPTASTNVEGVFVAGDVNDIATSRRSRPPGRAAGPRWTPKNISKRSSLK